MGRLAERPAMDWRLAVVGAVLLGAAVAMAGPGAPPLGGSGPPPVETLTLAGGDGGDAAGSAPTATARPPFAFAVESIDPCGTTCRDATITLRNQQAEPTTGVVVIARLYAGNSTDADAQVWAGEERVGELDAGATVTATKRVELGLVGASRVRAAGGWVTVAVTVRSDGPSMAFTVREHVG